MFLVLNRFHGMKLNLSQMGALELLGMLFYQLSGRKKRSLKK